jgi:hypothetical protein
MRKYIYTSLLILNTILNYSQNTFFIGDKTYPCTDTFTLDSHESIFNKLDISIAKDGSAGFIIVSTKATFSHQALGGNLTIYLQDNTTIKCIDRGIKDYVDNISTIIYKLTSEEIKRLMVNNINSIRYNIISSDFFGKQSESYTVQNYKSEKSYFSKESTDFPEKISYLFDNY